MNKNDSKEVTTTLDEIVKEVTSYREKQFDRLDVQVVIVDMVSGEILDEPPLFNFFKKLRYFEVNRNKHVFNVEGPSISLNYSNSICPFEVSVFYKAKIRDNGILSLIRAVYKKSSPIDAINDLLRQVITGYIFEKNDFVIEFNKYKLEVEDLLKKTGAKAGLDILPELKPNIFREEERMPEPFINFEHQVIAKTKDAQMVEVVHSLALTLKDQVKYFLGNINDMRLWAKNKLEQYTHNAIIEKSYAEVLVSMEESVIRLPMHEACNEIGYELKQLITVPGLEIEKFYLETTDSSATGNPEFGTKDTRLKISLNIIVEGRLNLHDGKTRNYIKPGVDIIAGMKKNVIDYARSYINQKTPEECFLQQYVFEDNLVEMIQTRLEKAYGFKELDIVVKFLETALSKRLALLQEKPWKVDILADWAERTYALWFRVLSVSQEGWYRFRANNYQDADEELRDIGRMVKNGMETYVLRTENDITNEGIGKEFGEIQKRVRSEFGLDIQFHDFRQEFSKGEAVFVKGRDAEWEEKLNRQKIILKGTTRELEELMRQKEDLIGSKDNDEEIKKINEKIEAIQNSNEDPKSLFLRERTSNNFLPSSDSSGEKK